VIPIRNLKLTALIASLTLLTLIILILPLNISSSIFVSANYALLPLGVTSLGTQIPSTAPLLELTHRLGISLRKPNFMVRITFNKSYCDIVANEVRIHIDISKNLGSSDTRKLLRTTVRLVKRYPNHKVGFSKTYT